MSKLTLSDSKELQQLRDAVQVVRASCTHNRETSLFFSKLVSDLDGWLARLEGEMVHVGIVGVTSSGKSTLINQFLGQDVLPTGAPPTSGIQVVCGYGAEDSARIYFSDGRQEYLVGDWSSIRIKMNQVADERSNPSNTHQVKEIQLTSKSWRLDRNMVLLDTPGLDAYGLDLHEQITLNMVLPTVDMVLYLTTTKADSDRKNLEFIDQATARNKPLVVIQNKVDSVEDKRTREATVPADDVRKEHKVRVEKLLKRAEKVSVQNAPVVQISAKLGFNGGRLDELAHVIGEMAVLNHQNRIIQSTAALKSIAGRAEDDLVAYETTGSIHQKKVSEQVERRELVVKARQQWEQDLGGLEEAYNADVAEANRSLEHIKFEINRGGNERVGVELEMVRNRLNSRFDSSLRSFSQVLKATQAGINGLCDLLDLPNDQVVRRTEIGVRAFDIAPKTKTVTINKTRRVEKGIGFWAAIGDFFGNDLGHEYVSYTENVTTIDTGALAHEIASKVKAFEGFFSGSLDQLTCNTDYSFNEFEHRLAEFDQEVANTQQANLNAGDVLSVRNALRGVLELPTRQPQVRNAKGTYEGDHTVLISSTLSSLELALVEYARLESFRLRRAFIDLVRSKAGYPKGMVSIVGWDERLIDGFEKLFALDEGDNTFVERCINPNSKQSWKSGVMFLLVNAAQSGSADGKIRSISAALTDYARVGEIVWVLDSVMEAVTGSPEDDSLVEYLLELIRLGESVMGAGQLFHVMANHSDLYYSLLINELYHCSSGWETEMDLQRNIDSLNRLFRLEGDARHQTARYIRNYQELKAPKNRRNYAE